MAARTGAFSRDHSRILRRDGREARTAGEILKGKHSALLTGGISSFPIQSHPAAGTVIALLYILQHFIN